MSRSRLCSRIPPLLSLYLSKIDVGPTFQQTSDIPAYFSKVLASSSNTKQSKIWVFSSPREMIPHSIAQRRNGKYCHFRLQSFRALHLMVYSENFIHVLLVGVTCRFGCPVHWKKVTCKLALGGEDTLFHVAMLLLSFFPHFSLHAKWVGQQMHSTGLKIKSINQSTGTLNTY